MKKIFLIVVLFAIPFVSPAIAGNACNDGTYSDSNGSGTCSHHGGERK